MGGCLIVPNVIAATHLALSFVFGVAGGPFPRAAIPLFGLLFALVAIWFLLVSRLFHRLRDYHPSAYVAIGSPTLLWNNSLRNQWLFLKFLLASQWRDLNDPLISRTVPLLRIWLVVYPILFFVLMALFVLA
jgi:hypothetical protein